MAIACIACQPSDRPPSRSSDQSSQAQTNVALEHLPRVVELRVDNQPAVLDLRMARGSSPAGEVDISLGLTIQMSESGASAKYDYGPVVRSLHDAVPIDLGSGVVEPGRPAAFGDEAIYTIRPPAGMTWSDVMGGATQAELIRRLGAPEERED